MKVALLACLMLLVSTIMFTACNITDITPLPDETTPKATTPEATSPEVTTPEITTPEVTTPEITTPEETTPAPHIHTEEPIAAVAPTCTETGLTEGKRCSICGVILEAQTIVDALGHTEIVEEAVDPTCTTIGMTKGISCSVCGETLAAQAIIPATHNIQEGVCTLCGRPASCETHTYESFAENKWGICLNCCYVDDYHEHIITSGICIYCGFEFEEVDVPSVFDNDGDRADEVYLFAAALPETFTKEDVIHINAVTEILSDNYSEYDETKGGTVQDRLPYAHVYCDSGTGQYLLYKVNVKEAGTYEMAIHIRLKDNTTRGAKYIINKGTENECSFETSYGWHDSDTAFEVRSNDLLQGAYMFGILVELQAGENTIHIYESSDVEKIQHFRDFYFVNLTSSHSGVVVDEAIVPTCTETGLTRGMHCTDCGEIIVAQKTIAALDHIYDSTVIPPHTTEDGYTTYTCIFCSDTYTDTRIFVDFTVTKDNRAMVGYTGAEESLIIPAEFEIDGTWYRTTCIGYTAFVDCRNLARVTIPDSVTSIDYSAFLRCSNLRSVIIPNSVTSIGDYAFEYCSNLRSITLPDNLTSIGSWAFAHCKSLTSITIPDSVTSIGENAFWDCSGLTNITLPDNLTSIEDYTFYDCSSLVSVTIPNNVTSIGYRAFENCSNLTSVTISDTVTSIGKSVFEGCTSLEEMVLPFVGESIDSGTFGGDDHKYHYGALGYLFGDYEERPLDIYINETVPTSLRYITITMDTTIADNAFANCGFIENISLPEDVISIGQRAFDGCTSLKSIGGGFDKLESIGDSAFRSCSSLERLGDESKVIRIPETVTSLGPAAFLGCTQFDTLIIDMAGAIEIPKSTFSGCTGLTNATVFGTITSIGAYAFSDCSSLKSIDCKIEELNYIGKDAFSECTSLERIGDKAKTIYIPATVTYLGSDAFMNCTQVEALTINMVGEIGDGAFDGCTGLTSITISDTVTSIGKFAFKNCGITEITIPDSVTSIGYSAFEGCNSLEKMVLPFVGKSIDASVHNYSSDTVYYDGALGYLFGDYIEKRWDFDFDINTTIPSSLRYITITMDTTIADNAFENCGFIETISLPEGVTIIGDSAFYNCTSLKKITIDMDGTIGSSAFSGCTGLVHITISGMVSTIGERAFDNCNSLDIVALPKGVTSIGQYTFNNCSELTNLYFGGTKSEWNSIQFASDWDTNANSYYVHYNAFEYGIYLPTGAIRLANAGKEYVLLPLGATAQVQVLDIKTCELISINDTNIHFEITSGTGKLLFNSGSLTGNSGGEGGISASYVSNGQTIKLEDAMPIFVVESSNFELDESFIRFSAADREYIAMCLDMYHSLYKTSNFDELIEIDMNIVENLLYGISNLDDYIAGLLEQDLPKTVALKKAISEFISDYIDENYAHLVAAEDTKLFLTGLEAVHEIYGDYKKLSKLPSKASKLVKNIEDLYIMAQMDGLTKEELIALTDFLKQLTAYNDALAEIVDTKAWKNTVGEINKTYKRYLIAIERVSSKTYLLDQMMDSTKFAKLLKDSIPGGLEIGMMTVDFLIYSLNDYSINIELLEAIRDQMVSAGGGYSDTDAEVNAIDELIMEYEFKWIEGFGDMVAKFAADTIVSIATKHPLLSAVKVASDLAMMITPIDEKAEWLALSCYRDALKQCMYPVKDLYLNGKITTDEDELKLFVSLYVNMLLKTNKLALDIANYSPEDNSYQIVILEDNISKLNNILSFYFN